MSSKITAQHNDDFKDLFPYRGHYATSKAGAWILTSARPALHALWYSMLLPHSHPCSLFGKFPFLAPWYPAPSGPISVPGLPDALVWWVGDKLDLDPTATVVFSLLIFGTLSGIGYHHFWRREDFPVTGPGGAIELSFVVGSWETAHVLAFVYLASINPTWSPELLRWMFLPTVFGFALHAGSDHIKWVWKQDQNNKGKVYTGGPWGVVRHPNYVGITTWRPAQAAAMGGWVAGLLGLFLFGYMSGIPGRLSHERYMKKNYGKRWDEAVEKVPYMFIPGIY